MSAALSRGKRAASSIASMDGRQFEIVAARIMSAFFGVPLAPRRVAGTPKRFDLVSDDGTVVGDVKYYAIVRGVGDPPAKRSVIA